MKYARDFKLHLPWMVVWTVFILVFAFLISPDARVQANKFMTPLPDDIDALDYVRSKLEKNENTFFVKKPDTSVTLVGQTHAAEISGDYDSAAGYAVIDFDTGEMLLEKNLDKRLPIASITKVMTAVVALDLAQPDELFSISKRAAAVIPTKIGVVAGQQMSVEELLHAVLMTSANDAAAVIREGIDAKYNSTIFIRAMNEKAQFIGLKNTRFDNPQGFDSPDNYSSAEDLAILSHYALKKYPLIEEIVKKEYYFVAANEHHKQFDLYNWNGLIGVYPNVSGVKIGNTDDAGTTTSVVSERNGKKLVAILLGAPGVLERDMWTAQLLDNGFAKSVGLKPVHITEAQLRTKYATWKYF